MTHAQGRRTFDYVVIGAGSAGSILAGNLSANPELSVLLLEAGGRARDWNQVWDPNQINCLYDIPQIHWGYRSVPQVHLNNRVLSCWRAKLTGGCTAHNDMVYARGAPADYDQWESLHGCTGWKYSDVRGNFERVEARLRPTTTTENQFGADYVAACEQLGLPYNPNYNSGGNMFGVSPLQSTIDTDFRRVTSYECYVAPFVDQRDNLTVTVYAQVTRIGFDENNRVTEVFYVEDGVEQRVGVEREVILSGGAINNPKILMCSGIGNADELEALGCDRIVADLPGVGQNLQDALIFMGTWSTRRPIYDQPVNEGYAIVWANMNQHQQAATCVEMMRGRYSCDESPHELESYYSVTGGMMRLESRGTVTLRSLDPAEDPVIDMNFLSAPGDYQQCVDGFQLMREIGNSAGLADWRGTELVPGPGVSSPEEIRQWILNNVDSLSHPVGTCQMGTGELAVVDPQLNVRGVSGLRIADVSIMPRITAGHTQGPAFMIGDKGSDLILGGG